jgi:hypothetical protein
MKPNQAAPLIAAAAPVALAAPPVLILAALGLGLLWLFSSEKKTEAAPAKPVQLPPPKLVVDLAPTPEASPSKTGAPAPAPRLASKRVTREDLAEALAYGERQFTRKEAVKALEALGFRKTCAYRALSETSKFASLMEFSSDGLVEWKG